jgi:hypothetical protein
VGVAVAAEGSDWFWWFGDDHFTNDRALFDRLFREHLAAVYARMGWPAPAWVRVPVVRAAHGGALTPIGLIRPTIDGERTQFYEWHAAGATEWVRAAAPCTTTRAACASSIRLRPRHFFCGSTSPERVPDATDLALELLAPAPRSQGAGLAAARPSPWRTGKRAAAGARRPPRGASARGARCVWEDLEPRIPSRASGSRPARRWSWWHT